MDKPKKRILSIGEASFVLSGFGTYNFEVLKRLHDTGKYEIAELACYGFVGDERANKIPWRYYANAVPDGDPRKAEYDSNAENQWGRWRSERVMLDFLPTHTMLFRDPWHDSFIFASPFRKFFNLVMMPTVDSCFVKGTHVITECGYKNIEDIQIEDRVLTNDGTYQSVLDTYEIPNTKPIVEIKCNHFCLPVQATYDHPILVIRQCQNNEHFNPHNSTRYFIEDSTYVNAETVKSGDYVIFPPIKQNNYIEYLDIEELLQDCPYTIYDEGKFVRIKYGYHKIPKQIPLNADVLKLFGWFITEGGINNTAKRITFTLNGATEQEHLTFIKNTLKKYFNLTRVTQVKRKTGLGEEVYACSVILNYIFVKLFGNNSKNKQIPNILMNAPPQQLIPLIEGMMLGDGSDFKTSHNKRCLSYDTVSKRLAIQTFQVLLKLGVLTSCTYQQRCNKNNHTYTIYSLKTKGINGQKIIDLFQWSDTNCSFGSRNKGRSWIDKHGNAIMRVQSVQKIEKNVDTVYNLKVNKNQTFVTSFIAHNCPYQENWIYDYSTADGVFTYTEWATKVLNEESNGTINLLGHASPGVNLDIFKPVDNKKLHKKNMGFMENVFLVATVMRNQKRKLFPDLLKAFRLFLNKCYERGREDLAQKTYLYFHTSYPDNRGWNFPELLKKEGLGHKVVFTYICQTCRSPFCSFFQDVRTICPHCHNVTAVLPSVGLGLSREQLAAIMQMFDCYVQYAIAGGIEMPAIEAGACGVVPFEVDYAGMSSAVRNLNGIPIKIGHTFLELETGANRVYPDNDYLAEQLYQYLIKPESVRKRMEYATRKGAEEHYNWDNIAKKWEDYFDNTELTGLQGQWDAPPNIHNIPSSIPPNLNNKDFVRWILIEVLNEPAMLNSYAELDLLRNINYGVQINGMNVEKISREQVFQSMVNRAVQKNNAEKIRCGMLPLYPEDYIQYAHERFMV